MSHASFSFSGGGISQLSRAAIAADMLRTAAPTPAACGAPCGIVTVFICSSSSSSAAAAEAQQQRRSSSNCSNHRSKRKRNEKTTAAVSHGGKEGKGDSPEGDATGVQPLSILHRRVLFTVCAQIKLRIRPERVQERVRASS